MKQYNRILFVAESGTSRAPMAAGILSEYTLKHPVTIECRGLVVLFPGAVESEGRGSDDQQWN